MSVSSSAARGGGGDLVVLEQAEQVGDAVHAPVGDRRGRRARPSGTSRRPAGRAARRPRRRARRRGPSSRPRRRRARRWWRSRARGRARHAWARTRPSRSASWSIVLCTSPHSSTCASETTTTSAGSAQRREHALQAHDLAEAIVDSWFDDEQVDVAVGSGLAARLRAEEDHPRAGGGLCDAPRRFVDEVVCDHRSRRYRSSGRSSASMRPGLSKTSP